MNKSISFLMAAIIFLTAVTPASSQRSVTLTKPLYVEKVEAKVEKVDTSTRFGELHAFSDGRGVVVSWKMESETDDVGFNVYRTEKRTQTTANESMVLGSKAHFGAQTVYGESYLYYDAAGHLGDVYSVESVNAAGRRVSTGKFAVEFTSDLARAAGMSFEQLAVREVKRNVQLSESELTLPRDIREEVDSYRSAPDMSGQLAIAALGGAKLGIRADGFYRVTKAELQAVGFPVNSDSSTWQLFCDGVEQSILVAANGDYIEFLGKAHETVESDLRYYFLTSGVSTGKRMGTSVLHPFGSSVISTNYGQTFFAKQRINYVNDILNGDAENYWGNLVTNSQSTYNFNLSGVDATAGNASVIVKLQGFSTTAHSVGLAINGQALPAATGLGTVPLSAAGNISASALHDGINTLQLVSGAGGDYSLFDSISITFDRKFQADQNQVPFYTSNYRGARVTGFSSPNIRMFDTTRDGDPVQLINLNIVSNGPKYDVLLPPNRGRTVYAVEDSAIKSVASVVVNNPSNLATNAHNANLVIIAYGDFLSQAANWAQYRQLQGFSVEVVDIADVFDEFNFGQSSSGSINAFLQFAVNNWQTPPQYVLLLGDASYDPKNYEGQGYLNLVPTKIVNTVYSETGSDDALADFNADGLADLSIGRIPAQSGQVVTNALAKVQAFETPALQDLNRGALFAYDMPIGYDFGAMSTILASNLPNTVPVTKISRGLPPPNDSTTDPNAPANLLNAINGGKYIVNYSGHGSLGIWASSSFFSYSNIPALTNANNQSIFTMLTCLNGYFIHPYTDSLSELLLKAQNGGAVAAWASTGLTTPDIQLVMGNRFYNQIGAGNITRMGDLVRDAKSVIPANADVRYSWVLLGDPMLKVR